MCGNRGVKEISQYLSLNFAVNLKCLYKKIAKKIYWRWPSVLVGVKEEEVKHNDSFRARKLYGMTL